MRILAHRPARGKGLQVRTGPQPPASPAPNVGRAIGSRPSRRPLRPTIAARRLGGGGPGRADPQRLRSPRRRPNPVLGRGRPMIARLGHRNPVDARGDDDASKVFSTKQCLRRWVAESQLHRSSGHGKRNRRLRDAAGRPRTGPCRQVGGLTGPRPEGPRAGNEPVNVQKRYLAVKVQNDRLF
jgi:hypothetical protein